MSMWSSLFGGDAPPPAAPAGPAQPVPTQPVLFQQNKPFNQGKQDCPLKKLKPCDVQKLVVKDEKSKRKLETTKKLTLDPIPASAPKWLTEPLGRYDLVLELIADYESSSAEPPEKDVELKITSYFTGKCQSQQHPLVLMEAIRGADKAETHSWTNPSPPPQKLLARSYAFDSHFDGFFLAPFWCFDSVKQIVVTATSCGIRHGGEGTPNAQLRCLVNIYRNDVFSLTIKIPPWKSLSKSREGTRNWKGERTSTQSSSTSSFGQKTSEASTKTTTNTGAGTNTTTTKVGGMTGKDQYTVLSETSGTKKGEVLYEEGVKTTDRSGTLVRRDKTSSVSDSTEKGKKETFLEPEAPEIVPTVIFKRNEHEIDFTEFVNNLFDLYKTLKEAWEALQGWVPQVGWSAKFSLDLFEGSIEGKWGSKYADAPPPSARYLAIRSFYEIKFAITIYKLKLEVAFGIDIHSSGVIDKLLTVKAFELILQAKGTISSKCTVNQTLLSSESPTYATLKSDNTLDIVVVARATLAGVTADARAGVTGGIAFEGKLKCSFTESPHVDGTFKMKKLTLYAQYTNPITGATHKAEKDVFEEKVLWKGALPGGKPGKAGQKKK